MAHMVTCVYCKQRFDRDKIPSIQVSTRRYAHKDCNEGIEDKVKQEQKDREELEKYIIELFKISYVDAKIQKQIKKYVEENHYTYSGILKSLKYFYEIKGNDIEKANGGIGIVPYVYQNAFNYYYSLWQAQQRNEDKNIEEYVPVVKEIVIPVPQRNLKKRKLFSFLDEEV